MLNKLTVIVPIYNEENTVVELLTRIDKAELINGIQKEIIVIDDGSTDNTASLVSDYKTQHPHSIIQYHKQERNKGKGAAVQVGIAHASGEYCIVQDADLEYDPDEYNLLLKTVIKSNADVVLGSRFMGGSPHRILFFWHSIGNKILTGLSNMFTNLNLTDIETGYKLFRTALVKPLRLKERRFGFEPEIIARLSRIKGIRIYEVGISYYGRTYDEGKKIKWKDGFRAIYCIIKYNLFS